MYMNTLQITFLLLLIVLPALCYKSNPEYLEYFKPEKLGESTSKLIHNIQYTFTPYYMNNTRNISQRGCETSKYWDCVNRHPDTPHDQSVNAITDKVDQECRHYSNNACYFPEMISHNRTEPYFQYLHYV